ncbi:ElyC/SanA/YdcF family protein [Candidatus Colwellia aromaticivorans]|uniref:ElyC/SanA/YdcF family protein n=1 Tax=Candidatus Colwellia aromaticivorans TaxID=2267621 RepID=UPI000DF11EA9|nr:ElyC/SanA/YdcF family protein [Candidatus Colwellia aromaticivorans]
MDLFVLKKVISIFLMPINLVFILLILAIIYFKKRPKVSFKYLISAVLLLLISSMPIISDTLMVSIENNYEAFTRSSKPVDYIVVLGNGHSSNHTLPVTSQLQVASLQRLVETLRIYKIHPEARIITSGFAGDDPVSNADIMKQSLVLLGIPGQKIITENFPKDTEEEAQLISPRVQGANVVLITNADHMPRSMKYFQLQGVFPIAAPTGYWVRGLNNESSWKDYLPSSKKLEQTTVAWYESLGRLVQWFKTLFN